MLNLRCSLPVFLSIWLDLLVITACLISVTLLSVALIFTAWSPPRLPSWGFWSSVPPGLLEWLALLFFHGFTALLLILLPSHSELCEVDSKGKLKSLLSVPFSLSLSLCLPLRNHIALPQALCRWSQPCVSVDSHVWISSFGSDCWGWNGPKCTHLSPVLPVILHSGHWVQSPAVIFLPPFRVLLLQWTSLVFFLLHISEFLVFLSPSTAALLSWFLLWGNILLLRLNEDTGSKQTKIVPTLVPLNSTTAVSTLPPTAPSQLYSRHQRGTLCFR